MGGHQPNTSSLCQNTHARTRVWQCALTKTCKATQRSCDVWCWPRPCQPSTKRSINTQLNKHTGNDSGRMHFFSPLGSFSASTKFPVGMVATLPSNRNDLNPNDVTTALPRARVRPAAWCGGANNPTVCLGHEVLSGCFPTPQQLARLDAPTFSHANFTSAQHPPRLLYRDTTSKISRDVVRCLVAQESA